LSSFVVLYEDTKPTLNETYVVRNKVNAIQPRIVAFSLVLEYLCVVYRLLDTRHKSHTSEVMSWRRNAGAAVALMVLIAVWVVHPTPQLSAHSAHLNSRHLSSNSSPTAIPAVVLRSSPLVEETAPPVEVPSLQKTDAAPPTQPPASSCPPWNRTVRSVPKDFSAKDFCEAFGEAPRRVLPRLWYGVMFSFELDMLEVLFHELAGLVDRYVIVESAMSHAKKQKPMILGQLFDEDRFRPFAPYVINGTFVARRSFRSGWDYEKRQRRRVLQVVQASGIRDGDIFVANLDLDEVFSRKTVMRYKYCASPNMVFHSFGYRYYLNCFMDESIPQFQRSVIVWANRDAGFYDLYKARTARIQTPTNLSDFRGEMKRRDSQLVWHMSTFGTFEDIRFKLSNSPHRFVDIDDNATLIQEIETCKYNNKTRTLVPLYSDQLPLFIQQNQCRFHERGWIRGVVHDPPVL
jgi:hypothetical protein